ncbi:hypothetical protein RUND412_002904 [Rhizina undulata]
MQYFLGNCGTVTHILANTRSNAGPYDADWLSREYQNPKLPFRRYPMKNHHAFGRLLTQHFTFNYHDNGEAGLGDTVLSISLGAPSRFRFRSKPKYVNGTQRWKSRDVNGEMVEMFGNAFEEGDVSGRK